MADFELLGLNELAPDARAPAAGDSGVVKNLKITQGASTVNGIVYVNGAGALTSGSGLQFNGGNVGIGVTPSAWTSKAIQIGSGGSGISTVNGTEVVSNAYYDAGTWRYVVTAGASWYSAEQTGNHKWFTAPSGTAGNPIAFTTVKTIDTSGNWLPGTDNTQNLGSGSLRMNSGYFGNGVYLGGTTAANLLDDYEEGTWTPVYVTSGGSFTYSEQTGGYTKVGRQVFCRASLATSSATVGSGVVTVAGLPFSASSNIVVRGGGGLGRATGFSGDAPMSWYLIEGLSSIYLNYRATTNGSTTDLDASDLNTGAGNGIYIEFSYFTA